jgi:hypothetical protein
MLFILLGLQGVRNIDMNPKHYIENLEEYQVIFFYFAVIFSWCRAKDILYPRETLAVQKHQIQSVNPSFYLLTKLSPYFDDPIGHRQVTLYHVASLLLDMHQSLSYRYSYTE